MEREKEQQLMMLLKEGNRDAFAIIYRQYKPELEQLLKRQGMGEDDIADILQEVFISLWNNRDKRKVTGSLKGYLIGAVRYRSFTLFRRTQTKSEKHVLYEHKMEVLATDAQAKRELFESLQQQLNLVANDVEKIVFKAFYENGEKPKDIAAELGMKPYKVRHILLKIHRSLKKIINK